MNLFLKLVTGSGVAVVFSALIGILYLTIMNFVVNFFRLNDGKDAYWVFQYMMYLLIISWILVFGSFLILT